MSETPAEPPSPTQAAAALRRGGEIDEAVRNRSGWFRRYLLIFAAAAVLMALLVGLAPQPVGIAVGVGVWVAVTGSLSTWAARQPVNRAGFARRHGVLIGAWTVLWAAVVVPGSIWFQGEPAWWVPGALLTAVPALAIYVRETST